MIDLLGLKSPEVMQRERMASLGLGSDLTPDLEVGDDIPPLLNNCAKCSEPYVGTKCYFCPESAS
jgi:hypothetical protein